MVRNQYYREPVQKTYHLFDIGTYEGHGVGLEGHIEITDLRDMLDFHPSKQLIEKNNFTLYNNYHK